MIRLPRLFVEIDGSHILLTTDSLVGFAIIMDIRKTNAFIANDEKTIARHVLEIMAHQSFERPAVLIQLGDGLSGGNDGFGCCEDAADPQHENHRHGDSDDHFDDRKRARAVYSLWFIPFVHAGQLSLCATGASIHHPASLIMPIVCLFLIIPSHILQRILLLDLS